MKKKIAENISVLIKTAQFENIEITKYAEMEIENTDQEEMELQEDQLSRELQASLFRTIHSIPDAVGKPEWKEPVQQVDEKIKKRIPEWLNTNPEPNLALENHKKSVGKQVSNRSEQQEKIVEVESLDSGNKVEGEADMSALTESDLGFEGDNKDKSVSENQEIKQEIKGVKENKDNSIASKEVKKTEELFSDADLDFNDEDLFGD